MQALLGTDKRPPELPADDSEPGRLTQAIAATRDGSENAEALRLLRAAGVQAVCGLAGYQPPRADSALPEPCPPEPRASVDKAAVIDHWVAQGRMAPVDSTHLFFTIWSATQTYADFDVQVCAVLGKAELTDADHERATRHVIGLILRGCGLHAE